MNACGTFASFSDAMKILHAVLKDIPTLEPPLLTIRLKLGSFTIVAEEMSNVSFKSFWDFKPRHFLFYYFFELI